MLTQMCYLVLMKLSDKLFNNFLLHPVRILQKRQMLSDSIYYEIRLLTLSQDNFTTSQFDDFNKSVHMFFLKPTAHIN